MPFRIAAATTRATNASPVDALFAAAHRGKNRAGIVNRELLGSIEDDPDAGNAHRKKSQVAEMAQAAGRGADAQELRLLVTVQADLDAFGGAGAELVGPENGLDLGLGNRLLGRRASIAQSHQIGVDGF